MSGYVNDPSELALLPEMEEDLQLEEPRDYHEFFHDDLQGLNMSPTVGWQRGINTQVCRFNSSGEHIAMAEDCPHFDMEDELGKRIRPGWTVQQNG